MSIKKEILNHMSVAKVETLVRALLDADSATVSYESETSRKGRKARANAVFGNVLQSHDEVEIKLTYCREPEREDDDEFRPVDAITDTADSSFDHVGEGDFTQGYSTRDSRTPEFLQKLAELERRGRGGFVWIGYVLNTVLPQMGFDVDEAREFVHALDDAGVVLISKVPNPKNPEYQTTRIQVNQEHAQVVDALQPASAEFTPVHVKGTPVSATIIADRR